MREEEYIKALDSIVDLIENDGRKEEATFECWGVLVLFTEKGKNSLPLFLVFVYKSNAKDTCFA